MPSIGRFLDLLEAVSRRDWTAIEEIGKAAAAEERKKKHFQAAHRISEALEVAVSRGGLEDSFATVASPAVAFNSTAPDILSEIDCRDVARLVLPSSIEQQVDELIGEWKLEDKLRLKGLLPRKTVLLYGPPGCGKSHMAKTIAASLNMRLFVVRFDSLISSYLGETGANLKKVFDFLAANRCALFLDEIDAIAKVRDDKNELGELKRVVISLLQNLDTTKGKSILIAATNHPHVLDPAIWRRFEFLLELMPPSEDERIKMFERNLETKIPKNAQEFLVKCSDGMTGSDILQICTSVKRKALLSNQNNMPVLLFLSILEHLRQFYRGETGDKNSDKRLIASIALKKLAVEMFSYNDLEKLSGIPHSTIHSKFSSLKGA